MDDQAQAVVIDPASGLLARVQLAPGESRVIEVHYATRELDELRCHPANCRAAVAELDVRVHINFAAVDFPPGSLSPMRARAQPDSTTSESEHGRLLRWHAPALLTNKDIVVLMPARLYPGPVVA